MAGGEQRAAPATGMRLQATRSELLADADIRMRSMAQRHGWLATLYLAYGTLGG
jgi:hypothetical protein